MSRCTDVSFGNDRAATEFISVAHTISSGPRAFLLMTGTLTSDMNKNKKNPW